jgi:hypothetical protein
MKKNTREVTEQDFRKEEYLNAKPEDYEFREDGALVRKDRFEVGIKTIAVRLGFRDFEISEILEKIDELITIKNQIEHIADKHSDRFSDHESIFETLDNINNILNVVK